MTEIGKKRILFAAAAFAVYAGAIIASNWLIGHVGIPTGPGGPHLSPVGFGLMAPSGVWAAAVSFPATKETRAMVLTERIESFQSPARLNEVMARQRRAANDQLAMFVVPGDAA